MIEGCAVSPEDQAGQIDNIFDRLEALEQAVAELQAQNTQALQLSDISNQVGWVYGVTYMGIEGWTQTAAGTLIPPAGMSLSSLGITPPSIPGIGGSDLLNLWSFFSTASPDFKLDFGGAQDSKKGNAISIDGGDSTKIKITSAGVYLFTFSIDIDPAFPTTATEIYLYGDGDFFPLYNQPTLAGKAIVGSVADEGMSLSGAFLGYVRSAPKTAEFWLGGIPIGDNAGTGASTLMSIAKIG